MGRFRSWQNLYHDKEVDRLIVEHDVRLGAAPLCALQYSKERRHLPANAALKVSSIKRAMHMEEQCEVQLHTFIGCIISFPVSLCSSNPGSSEY